MDHRMDRRTLLRAGLVTGLGSVALGAAALSAPVPLEATKTTLLIQQPWRWCKKCQGLSWWEGLPASKCPAGGLHVQSSSLPYYMYYSWDEGPSYWWQDQWRWCRRCQELSYNGGVLGWCPAGGRHDHAGSYNYFMSHDNPYLYVPRQNGWRFCEKCMGLFYGPGQDASWCPQADRHRASASSFDYQLRYDPHGVVPN